MSVLKLYLVAAASLMNAVSVGIAATYSSPAMYSMSSSTSPFKPNEVQSSWIISILALGALFGGVIAGYLADKIGRKGVLMVTSVPFVIGWLLIAYNPIFSVIVIGRLLTGICVGFICVVTPMYLVEISTPAVRGTFGSSFQLWISLGVLIVSVLGLYMNWEWLAICGAASTVIAVFVMCFIPESPKWLLKEEKHSEAARATEFLYGTDFQVTEEILPDETASSEYKTLTWSDFRQPGVYKPALLSLGLVFFQQSSGSNAVLFNTVLVLKHSKTSIDPLQANVYIALTMLIFTGISSYFMDRAGRKVFLFISGFLMFLSLTALGLYAYYITDNAAKHFGWVPLMCLMLYIAAFSVGFGPITWLMMPEMSPINARGIICGAGTAICWLFVFIVTKTFADLENSLHDYGAFWTYAAFCLLSCFFTIFLLPETKGKTSRELAMYFTGQHRQSLEALAYGSEATIISS